MRAMHDSSSSWTERSLPPRAEAAALRQAAVADMHPPDAQTCQQEQPQKTAVPILKVPATAAACSRQTATAATDAGNGVSFVSLLMSDVSCVQQQILELGGQCCSQLRSYTHVLGRQSCTCKCAWNACTALNQEASFLLLPDHYAVPSSRCIRPQDTVRQVNAMS